MRNLGFNGIPIANVVYSAKGYHLTTLPELLNIQINKQNACVLTSLKHFSV